MLIGLHSDRSRIGRRVSQPLLTAFIQIGHLWHQVLLIVPHPETRVFEVNLHVQVGRWNLKQPIVGNRCPRRKPRWVGCTCAGAGRAVSQRRACTTDSRCAGAIIIHRQEAGEARLARMWLPPVDIVRHDLLVVVRPNASRAHDTHSNEGVGQVAAHDDDLGPHGSFVGRPEIQDKVDRCNCLVHMDCLTAGNADLNGVLPNFVRGQLLFGCGAWSNQDDVGAAVKDQVMQNLPVDEHRRARASIVDAWGPVGAL
jgi:hypothetical protein